MTGFKLDFDNTFESGNTKIEDGAYEIVIENAQENATKNGAEYLDFWFRIRNDIKQPSRNQVIFHKIWKAKATNKYNATMINTLGKTARLENGKSYSGLQDLLDDFVGKPLKATVKNETSEKDGKTYENLNVKFTDFSEFPNVQHDFKNKEVDSPFKNDKAVSINEDDLPF